MFFCLAISLLFFVHFGRISLFVSAGAHLAFFDMSDMSISLFQKREREETDSPEIKYISQALTISDLQFNMSYVSHMSHLRIGRCHHLGQRVEAHLACDMWHVHLLL